MLTSVMSITQTVTHIKTNESIILLNYSLRALTAIPSVHCCNISSDYKNHNFSPPRLFNFTELLELASIHLLPDLIWLYSMLFSSCCICIIGSRRTKVF